MDEPRYPESLLLRLTAEEKEWLKGQAHQLDRSMGSVVRRLIDQEQQRKAAKT